MPGDFDEVVPIEDFGSETLFRYGYQGLLAVPLCAEMLNDGPGIRALYPEFVEDLAIEADDGWLLVQVKSHDPRKPHWTLSEVISSGAFSSLWRAHVTVRELANARNTDYELGIWLSGPMTAGKRGRRDLLQVLVADCDRDRLVGHSEWIERIQERFDDCSAADAEAKILELIQALAGRVEVRDGDQGTKRKITADEASVLVEKSFVELKPPLDGAEDAARQGLHQLGPHLTKREFDQVFDRLRARVMEAASASRQRTQQARLFAAVFASPETGEEQRIHAEAKRISRGDVRELLRPLTDPPAVDVAALHETTLNSGDQLLEVVRGLLALQSRRFEDLFDVVTDPADVPEAVFRATPRDQVAPYLVPYVEGRRATTSFQNDFENTLTASGGMVLMRGRAGLGKTRELAETVARFCERGWTACIAKGDSDATMGRLESFPDALRNERVLFVLDDMHRRAPSLGSDQRSYIERFGSFLDSIEGGFLPGDMYVIATACSEKHHARALDFDLGQDVWRRFRLVDLPECTVKNLEDLLTRAAERAGVRIAERNRRQLILDSDRCPSTVVSNVDRARLSKAALTHETWLPNQGRTWEIRLREALGIWPQAEQVYASFHLIHDAGLPYRDVYVERVTASLGGENPRTAMEGLLDMGILGQRQGLLDVFAGIEHVREVLVGLGSEPPRIERNWRVFADAVLRTVAAEPSWSDDADNFMVHPGLPPDAREWIAGSLIEQNSERARPYQVRAAARFEQGENRGAESDYTEFIARQPDSGVAYALRGIARLARTLDEGEDGSERNVRNAVADFTEALALQPELDVATYFRGIARAQLGDLEAAKADLARALERSFEIGPEGGTVLFRIGQVCEDLGDYEAAEDYFSSSIEQGRQNSDVFDRRANVRMNQSDISGAVADFSEAIDRGRDDPGVFMQRGLMLMALNDSDAAERDFMAAVARDPDLADAHFWLGQIRSKGDDPKAAEEDLSNAIRLGVRSADVYRIRGQLRHQLDRFADAEQDFTVAIELGEEEDAGLYFQRGMARLSRGAAPEAAEDFTRAIELGDADPAIHYFRGIATPDIELAEADFTVAVEAHFQDPHVFANRASARIRLGDLKGAREDCVRASEVNPDSPDTEQRWGELHLAESDYDDSVRCFRAAIELEDTPEVRFALGLALLLGEHVDEAEAVYREAIENADPALIAHQASKLDEWSERRSDRLAIPAVGNAANRIAQMLTSAADRL